MDIYRRNFRFNRILNVEEVLTDSALFYMEQNDIDSDGIVKGEHLEQEDTVCVLMNNAEPHRGERYCYIKTRTQIGDDRHTKAISIDKIIIDGNLINQNLFVHIITIVLQQEDNEYPNRIIVGNINKCFHRNITETANEIGIYIYNLYNTYTSDLISIYSTQQ